MFANGEDQTPVNQENYHAPIKSIGNSTTTLGGITPRELSGGVKTLILIHRVPDKIFNASTCGDNCAKWILKREKRKISQLISGILWILEKIDLLLGF